MTLHDHDFSEMGGVPSPEKGDVLMFDAAGVLVHTIAFSGETSHITAPWRDVVRIVPHNVV